MKTKPNIDLGEVCVGLETTDVTHRWYLDAETGEAILVNAAYEPADYAGRTAQEIETRADRYRRFPKSDEGALLDDMIAFMQATSERQLRESLEIALAGQRPERRFKAVLGWLPEENDRWKAFRQERLESRARAFLKAMGFSP